MHPTGYCACNYTATDVYDEYECGPIHATYEKAKQDTGYEGIRYVATDGYLYVEPPTDD